MNKKTMTLANSTMAFIEEGKGQPIVLLHGFCGSAAYWEKTVPELSKQYRVIVPDLPGHGASSADNLPQTIEGMAENVKLLLDELEIENAVIFGHSLGGYVALAFAEKNSDRLSGFSLVHSTAFPDAEEAKKGRDATIEKVKNHGVHVLIDVLVPRLFAKEKLITNAKDVENAKDIGYTTSPEGVIAGLQAMKTRPDRNHVLENTHLPVLLVAGEGDQVISPERTFSAAGPTITHSLIKKAGHISMLEEPDELIREMLSFLKKVQ
ncbi:alpha/beta hydrolase [Domibacillus antri]|uniref:Alpha/beta hydrolase n=2 Tax=Domibacillus antri TaxID=1714264 RepID=A0A1Q8Q5I1_9BACI|nr:alpha/beta hydrolase [Domibacillus antri]OLN22604.1 alpha/beta hydrolase [Domibacillus antri]